MTAGVPPGWLRPDWRMPRVGALMTTRAGGTSQGVFAGLNLRDGLGDDPARVARNQALLTGALRATPVWLNQVHGKEVAALGAAEAAPGAALRTADASVTSVPGIACVVQVADCLPVLFAAPDGAAVGAAHAGWRGLAAGVLESTLAAVCDAGACAPGEVRVWLGASIGPRRFEVGADVLHAFDATRAPGALSGRVGTGDPPRFVPSAPGKWLANLPLLARDRLRSAGALHVSGGIWCTLEDPSRFFSYRRDGVTGRMAAAIWIEPRA